NASFYKTGIFDKDQLLGFIGFDNCRGGSLRNEVEIDEIATICNILSTFFVKLRTDEAIARDTRVKIEVMNHLRNYVYVVNPETFEVLFMNHQARNLVQGKECTTPCYEYFLENQQQCDSCPIRRMQEENSRQSSRETYVPHLGIWVEISATALRWLDGSPCYLLECADITVQKEEHLQHIAQLEKLAFYDPLTGCRTLYKFLEDAREILQRQMETKHFLVKMDIENFKLINQIYGYQKGDDILQCVARAIEKTGRDGGEIYARVFNDEFVALFSMEDSATISALNDDFIKNFYSELGRHFTFNFTFAYGVYVIEPTDLQTLDVKDLFERVNVAHKAAKLDKSHRFIIYDDTLIQKALHTKEIENKMAHALAAGEFIAYLQPKYRLDTETICGAEALTRWRNENTDLFLPGAFIAVLERNGFITKVDFHALYNVCCVIKGWIEAGITPVPISVNFSRLHLSNRKFVRNLCQVVDSVGIERKWIEIEITETAIYDNIETLRILLDDLHQNGFTMSMDDFGSGYSSLGMLKDLPVDIIKMDGSFFMDQKDPERS
ncbi:MAG: EAL domain-containing protein, partial [Oscillospiraceae bacterium]